MGSPEENLVAVASVSTTSEDSDENGDQSPPSHPCPFSEGEKVLAFHSFLIYEAKVLKTEYRLKEWRCYLHYLGWSKTWDEWVGLDRLLKLTNENLKKQTELNEKLGKDKKPSRGSPNKSKNANVVRGKKRKSDVIKEKGVANMEKLVNIQIPVKLKKQLVDDSEFLTHLGKLVKLPRTPNVEDILKRYLEYRLKKDGAKDESVGEMVKGLICYFDKALPSILLYKSERQQYKESVMDDAAPSTIYGAEHLLRLFGNVDSLNLMYIQYLKICNVHSLKHQDVIHFSITAVRLPELLYQANIEEETLTELQQKLVDFLKFLRKNQSAFFLSTYYVPENKQTSTNDQDA